MMPFASLLAALDEIQDPRRPQGRRYTLAHLLLFSVLAVLAGATSYQSIITFMSVHRERLNAIFGAHFRRAPAVNTLRNLFLALDPADLEAAFRHHARHLDERTGRDGWRTVARDGNTLRGSFDHLHDQTAAHVLSAFASDAALILAHQEVEGSPDEVFDVDDRLGPEWQPLVACAARISRLTWIKDTRSGLWAARRDVAYYACQIRLDAPTLACAVRDHWGIENRDHHVRDRILREDDSRIRRKRGLFARLRSFALNILRANGVANVSQALYANALSFNRLLAYGIVNSEH